MTIVMVTHDMNDTLVTDKMFVLDEGKLILSGTPRSVFKNRDKLLDCGIDIPFMILFSLKLMDKGIINHIYLDLGKLVDDIWK